MNAEEIRFNRLIKWQHKMIKSPTFLGLPDRWLSNPTWGCCNGHASKRFLKSERLGLNVCLQCQNKIILVPPESTDAILSNIVFND